MATPDKPFFPTGSGGPTSAPAASSPRNIQEIFRLSPVLYKLFFELKGDLTKIHARIVELHSTFPQELFSLADIVGRAMKHFPENLFLNYIAGVISVLHRRPLAASQAFKRILEIAKKTQDLDATGQALCHLEAIFPLDIGLVERRAELLIQQGKRDEAAEKLEKVAEELMNREEKLLAAHCFWLAYQTQHSRRWLPFRVEEALSSLSVTAGGFDMVGRFLNKEPKCAALYQTRGQFLMQQGEKRRADSDFLKAEQLAAENPEDLIHLHRVLIRQGLLDGARRVIQKLSELDPDESIRRTISGRSGDRGSTPTTISPSSHSENVQKRTRTGPHAILETEASVVFNKEPEVGRSLPLRLLLLLSTLLLGYFVARPTYLSFVQSRQDEKLAQDFVSLRLLVQRRILEKKPLLDNSFQSLVDMGVLGELTKDPWGHEYVYDWVMERVVCVGENGLLETEVPGWMGEEKVSPSSDDVIRSIWDIPDWLVATSLVDNRKTLRNYSIGGQALGDISQKLQARIMGLDRTDDQQKLLLSLEFDTVRSMAVFDRQKVETRVLPLSLSSPRQGVWVDSGQIVVQSDRENSNSTSELYWIDLSTWKTLPLTQDFDDARDPTVDTKSRVLYFVGTRGDRVSIWQMQIPDGKPKPWLTRTGRFRAVSVSPEGKYLAWILETGSENERLEVANASNREVILTLEDAMAGGYPVWSRDGTRLMYLQSKPKKGRVALCHMGKKRALSTTIDGPAPGRFCWLTTRSTPAVSSTNSTDNSAASPKLTH